jgi:hypothetical protein
VTKPLILGLSPELLSRKSHGAPSGKYCCSRAESATAHMTANTARIERLMTLEFAINYFILFFTVENNAHLGIHLSLHLASLTGCSARVHYNLGIQASKKDDTDDPFRVS